MAPNPNNTETDNKKDADHFKKAFERSCVRIHVGAPDFPDTVTVGVSPKCKSNAHTPKEQAIGVIENGSMVCGGAHMSEENRQMLMKIDGKAHAGLRETKPMKGHEDHSRTLWVAAME